MALITANELRSALSTSLLDGELDEIIEREEAELVRRAGANWSVNLELTEKHVGGERYIFTDRPIDSVTTVTESSDNFVNTDVLTATEYRVAHELDGAIERLSAGVPIKWRRDVEVVYAPTDDTLIRKAVLIELCRIGLERQAMRQEAIGGEYSFKTPEDWELERVNVIKRLFSVPVWL